MATTTFDFEAQLKQGFEGEAELVAHLTAQGWHCIKATIAQEKTGIDYICKHKKTGVTRTIEIKSDSRASHTQNAFIETVSVKKGKNILNRDGHTLAKLNICFITFPLFTDLCIPSIFFILSKKPTRTNLPGFTKNLSFAMLLSNPFSINILAPQSSILSSGWYLNKYSILSIAT